MGEETLMTLVNDCEKTKAIGCGVKEEKIVRLKELGFNSLANIFLNDLKKYQIAKYEYIVITSDKIKKYIKTLVDKYNRIHPEGSYTSLLELRRAEYMTYLNIPNRFLCIDDKISETTLSISHKTNDYNTNGPIGKFVWQETNISEYLTIPPENILQALKVHQERNIFDYFTIATINTIKDPLLLGRINHYFDRFYIAQWGEDVTLDDII